MYRSEQLGFKEKEAVLGKFMKSEVDILIAGVKINLFQME